MIKWLCALFRQPPPRPRELRRVGWMTADEMLKRKQGWRIAPEEDHNPSRTHVYLERYIK